MVYRVIFLLTNSIPYQYLFLFGQTVSLARNSTVKKMTTKLSMRSMMRTMRGKSTLPSSSFWSSSAVEMMKVTVEITTWFWGNKWEKKLLVTITMKREKRARTWASLLVHGYSIVHHSQDRHWKCAIKSGRKGTEHWGETGNKTENIFWLHIILPLFVICYGKKKLEELLVFLAFLCSFLSSTCP